MKFLPTFHAFRWLVGDTFRQAQASGVLWAIFAVTAICYLLCLSVTIKAPRQLGAPGENREFQPKAMPIKWTWREVNPPLRNTERNEVGAKVATIVTAPIAASGPTAAIATYVYFDRETHPKGLQRAGGEISLAFGGFPVPWGRDTRSAVVYLQLLLASGVADVLGLLLALVWTSGFMPSFLEPSAVSVLLAKPLPRWALLAGKFLGVIAFVFVNALVFVLGTWFILGLRTAVWDPTYLLCIPILVIHFSIFFSFSTLLAVYTRSPSACIFGSVGFWFMCWGMNIGRHYAVANAAAARMGAFFGWLAEAGYWFLPKPADLGIIYFNALGARDFGPEDDPFGIIKTVQGTQFFSPEWSVATSLIFMAVMVALAAHHFLTTDY